MRVKLSSASLRKAAEIQERIERLESELDHILQGEAVPKAIAPSPAAAAPRLTRRGTRGRSTRSTALNGRGRGPRSTSPSGPLTPAVVLVLKSRSPPTPSPRILHGLTSNSYKS